MHVYDYEWQPHEKCWTSSFIRKMQIKTKLDIIIHVFEWLKLKIQNKTNNPEITKSWYVTYRKKNAHICR